MSHLIHIVRYKEQLTAQGIACPVQQSALLKEPFTRAIIRFFYQNGAEKTAAFEGKVWKQLEKWNNISPIPAQLIMSTFDVRMNVLRNAMLKRGTLPPYDEFTTTTAENGTVVDVSQVEEFDTLVDYLLKELENCNE